MIACLYEDEEILVLDKPSGLAVQPGAGVRVCLVDAVERDYGFRPYLAHRLDRETAGLIIVAKDRRAASRWTQAIGSREVAKVYRAVTGGVLRGERGVFREPVRVRGESLSAETKWRLLARFGAVPAAGQDGGGCGDSASGSGIDAAAEGPRFSYLELELRTGRTHQIRLHLAQNGAPILGDDQHGDFALNKSLRKEAGLRRLLLLSWRLVLPGGRVITASMPEQFVSFFAAWADGPDPELP
jgi:23S rRNA pseudouridine955/2504/2580 synthase